MKSKMSHDTSLVYACIFPTCYYSLLKKCFYYFIAWQETNPEWTEWINVNCHLLCCVSVFIFMKVFCKLALDLSKNKIKTGPTLKTSLKSYFSGLSQVHMKQVCFLHIGHVMALFSPMLYMWNWSMISHVKSIFFPFTWVTSVVVLQKATYAHTVPKHFLYRLKRRTNAALHICYFRYNDSVDNKTVAILKWPYRKCFQIKCLTLVRPFA